LDVRAESAGTFAAPGAPASALALRAAAARGADLSGHLSRRLTPEVIATADLVVAMTEGQLELVRHLGGADLTTALATDWLAPGHPEQGAPVSDPFGGDEQVYEKAADLIRECVSALVDHIQEAGGTS
jgi:protein-tyrosine-phosphatase